MEFQSGNDCSNVALLSSIIYSSLSPFPLRYVDILEPPGSPQMELRVAPGYFFYQGSDWSITSGQGCPGAGITVQEQPLLEARFPLVCEKTQCIVNIGDNRCTYEYRTRTYSTPHKMMNHVDSHLKEVLEFQRISCTHPVCKSEGLVLNHLQHFKSHVQYKQCMASAFGLVSSSGETGSELG
jgi:hypothetical protein